MHTCIQTAPGSTTERREGHTSVMLHRLLAPNSESDFLTVSWRKWFIRLLAQSGWLWHGIRSSHSPQAGAFGVRTETKGEDGKQPVKAVTGRGGGESWRGEEGWNEGDRGGDEGTEERAERGASVALSQQYNSSQTSSSFLEHHRSTQHERESCLVLIFLRSSCTHLCRLF